MRELYPTYYEIPLLVLCAGILLGVGLCLPLFHVTQMVFWKSSYSVLTGVANLIQQGDYFLGSIIFIFSVIFPIVKLLALSAVWMVKLSPTQRSSALYWLGFLGKWSMLDVLLLALTLLAVKMKSLAHVEPQRGVYVFCAAIFFSMLATTRMEYLARKTPKSS